MPYDHLSILANSQMYPLVKIEHNDKVHKFLFKKNVLHLLNLNVSLFSSNLVQPHLY